MGNEKTHGQIVEANNLLNLSTHMKPLLIKKENILFIADREREVLIIKDLLKIKYITELPTGIEVKSFVATYSPEYGYDMYECHWSLDKMLKMLKF